MVTMHYLERAKERMGLTEHQAVRHENLAYFRGLISDEMPCRERRYMEAKESCGCLARYYNGNIYIHDVEGLCITVYNAPEWFWKKSYFIGKTEIRHPQRCYRYNLDKAC